MKGLKFKIIEDCLEGTNVRDILLDDVITKDLIDKLAPLGKLIYESSMEKPFFKLIVRGRYTLKGSEGNKSIRVLLPESAGDEVVYEIIEFIGKISL